MGRVDVREASKEVFSTGKLGYIRNTILLIKTASAAVIYLNNYKGQKISNE